MSSNCLIGDFLFQELRAVAYYGCFLNCVSCNFYKGSNKSTHSVPTYLSRAVSRSLCLSLSLSLSLSLCAKNLNVETFVFFCIFSKTMLDWNVPDLCCEVEIHIWFDFEMFVTISLILPLFHMSAL
jgi:hypothetical protein